MRRFKFNLQALLWLRRQREEMARRVLAEWLAARAAARAALDHARSSVADAEAYLRRASDAESLKAAAALLDFRRHAAERATRHLHEVQERLADARARFLLHRRGRRVVERLRARRLAAHLAAEARREQAQADELAVVRHSRREP